jgi:hypothetical protein
MSTGMVANESSSMLVIFIARFIVRLLYICDKLLLRAIVPPPPGGATFFYSTSSADRKHDSQYIHQSITSESCSFFIEAILFSYFRSNSSPRVDSKPAGRLLSDVCVSTFLPNGTADTKHNNQIYFVVPYERPSESILLYICYEFTHSVSCLDGVELYKSDDNADDDDATILLGSYQELVTISSTFQPVFIIISSSTTAASSWFNNGTLLSILEEQHFYYFYEHQYPSSSYFCSCSQENDRRNNAPCDSIQCAIISIIFASTTDIEYQ